MKRRVYPDGRVVCPEQEGLVEYDECLQCPFFGKVEAEGNKRYIVCRLEGENA
jgi:hypothetical protein